MRRVRKLVAAILGGLTATAVVAVARMAGVELAPEVAGLIVLVAASVATYLAPANEAPLPTLTAAELRGMADRAARQEREAPR
jgi:hypothetical protein